MPAKAGIQNISIAMNWIPACAGMTQEMSNKMKYMEQGGFQNHPHMRLTLGLTLIFLAGFWVTNLLLYFAKMSLTPSSVIAYYLGSEEAFMAARTYQSLLEVSHSHLPMMAMVLLLLTHLVIFAPLEYWHKTAIILTAFFSALAGESASWLIRYVHPNFAYLKIAGFVTLQITLLLLMALLTGFLFQASRSPIHRQRQKFKTDI